MKKGNRVGHKLDEAMKALIRAKTVAAGGVVVVNDREMIDIDIARSAIRETMAFVFAAQREELGAIAGIDAATQERMTLELDAIERRLEKVIVEWKPTLN